MCTNLKGYLIIYVTLHSRCFYTSIYVRIRKYFKFLLFTFILLKTIKASRESIKMVPINVFFDHFDFRHQIYQIFYPPFIFFVSYFAGDDWDFEDSMAELGCTVHAYDPYVTSPNTTRENLHFYKIGKGVLICQA